MSRAEFICLIYCKIQTKHINNTHCSDKAFQLRAEFRFSILICHKSVLDVWQYFMKYGEEYFFTRGHAMLQLETRMAPEGKDFWVLGMSIYHRHVNSLIWFIVDTKYSTFPKRLGVVLPCLYKDSKQTGNNSFCTLKKCSKNIGKVKNKCNMQISSLHIFKVVAVLKILKY